MSSQHLRVPLLFPSHTDSWSCRSWTFKSIAEILQDSKFSCRLSPKTCSQIMEPDCMYEEVTVQQLCDWVYNDARPDSPLSKYPKSKNSCYLDYKYMKDMFAGHPMAFQQVRWQEFGLADLDGEDSTIWLGSSGANTPGHQDSYGFNLVTQIVGRKLWLLFPPEDTQCMYPTRIPYEESSVFTQVNFRRPDLEVHPEFKKSHPHIVVLEPGQTLYVPHHWWHYVESLEPSISVNVWVPIAEDKWSRVEEAVTRCIASSLIPDWDTSKDACTTSMWLNPTEALSSSNTNLHLLKTALCQLKNIRNSLTPTSVSADKLHPYNGHLESHAKNEGTLSELCSKEKHIGKDEDHGHDDFQRKESENSYLTAFREKLKGSNIVSVQSPYGFTLGVSIDKKNPTKRKNKELDRDYAKKQRMDEDVTFYTDSTTESEIRFHADTRVLALKSCSFVTYINFLDDLCKYSQCSTCGFSQESPYKPTQISQQVHEDRNSENSIHQKSDSMDSTSSSSRLHLHTNVPMEGIAFTDLSTQQLRQNLNNGRNEAVTTAESKHVSYLTPEAGDSGMSSLSQHLVVPSDMPQAEANRVHCEYRQPSSSSVSHSLDSSSPCCSENSCAVGEARHMAIHLGTSVSEMTESEMAENLLMSILHPDVIGRISELFKQKCDQTVHDKLNRLH